LARKGYHYEVGDLPVENTDDMKAYMMTLRGAEAIMKREGKIVILDNMYGWLELTSYLKSVHGDTFNELIPMLQENKRKSLRLLWGRDYCWRQRTFDSFGLPQYGRQLLCLAGSDFAC
jgi:hypothetical protein